MTWQNDIPFDKAAYTEFDDSATLNQEQLQFFIPKLTNYFGIHLYAIDIIIDKKTGK